MPESSTPICQHASQAFSLPSSRLHPHHCPCPAAAGGFPSYCPQPHPALHGDGLGPGDGDSWELCGRDDAVHAGQVGKAERWGVKCQDMGGISSHHTWKTQWEHCHRPVPSSQGCHGPQRWWMHFGEHSLAQRNHGAIGWNVILKGLTVYLYLYR